MVAGPLYSNGIPIRPERELEKLIRKYRVEEVIFACSDVSYDTIARLSRRVEATGATFHLFDADKTRPASHKPVVAICAVHTGCRPAVLWRETGFGCRSIRGRGFAAAMPTVTRSLRARQRGVLDFLVASIETHRCGRVGPSLVSTWACHMRRQCCEAAEPLRRAGPWWCQSP